MKKLFAAILAIAMMMTVLPALAEDAEVLALDEQKLTASYTLALNAIEAEDYETAKDYLNICFAYCDRQTNPAGYAELLLKKGCIDVIQGKNEMALLNLDAAIRVYPELADAYLVRTQVYASMGDADQAILNLEQYIELTKDTSLYETVAQLHEAKGDIESAQAAYEKYVEGVGSEVEEAGFQNGLYKMESGKFEEAIADFEAYRDNETYGAGAMYNIGVSKMKMADYAGAAEAFDACQEKGGTFDGLLYNRGVCKLLNNQAEEAAEDFVQSIEKESFKDDARYNLAICRMQAGDYEGAVVIFTEYIDGSGEEGDRVINDGAYFYRAACNAALGNLEAAEADYTVCIEKGYALADSYQQRSDIYAAMGETEKQNSDLAEFLKYAK